MESAQIYINKGGEQFGPFSSDDVPSLIQNGHFAWEDFAWREGFEDWVPLREVLHGLAGSPPVQNAPVAKEEEEPPRFFRELVRAFGYPFRGGGAWAILLFGTIMVTIMGVVSVVPLFGLVGYVLITGYYIAFLFKIILESAIGEQEMAEFPGLQDVWDDILRPFVQVFVAFLGCLLPAFLALALLPEELAWIGLLLFVAGLFYLPMTLLATVIFNSVLTALNPVLILPAISRIFLRYMVIILLLAGTVVAHTVLIEVLGETLPWLAAFLLLSFIAFYVGIIQARILGLIYRTSKDEIGWFNR